jgi:hypothetical protein
MTSLKVVALGALAAVAVLATGAHAATNLVQNGDFSQAIPGTGPLQLNSDVNTVYGSGNLAAWSCGPGYCGNLQSVNQPTAPMGDLTNGYTPNLHNPTGQNFYYMDGDPQFDTGSLYQTINGLKAGETYTLTFFDAFVNENAGTVGNTDYWSVSLGGTVTPGGNHVTGGQVDNTSPVTVDPGGTDWAPVTMSFTATSASEILAFTAVGTGFPPFALVQDVVLTSAAPEPAEWVLMIAGIGGVGAALRARRRKVIA